MNIKTITFQRAFEKGLIKARAEGYVRVGAEAFAGGYAKGYTEGHAEGYMEGHAEGYTSGRTEVLREIILQGLPRKLGRALSERERQAIVAADDRLWQHLFLDLARAASPEEALAVLGRFEPAAS